MAYNEDVMALKDYPYYISQDDLLKQYQPGRGYKGKWLSPRTLTYWRQEGIIGSLVRTGNHYYITPADQEIIAKLMMMRDLPDEEVMELNLEGDVFSITGIDIVRRDGKLLAKLFTKQGGFLIKELEEGALNGL